MLARGHRSVPTDQPVAGQYVTYSESIGDELYMVNIPINIQLPVSDQVLTTQMVTGAIHAFDVANISLLGCPCPCGGACCGCCVLHRGIAIAIVLMGLVEATITKE